MKYRFVILNKSMNVVYTSRFDIYSFAQFKDIMNLKMSEFWKMKCIDENSSFRLIPDIDTQIDLFTQNNNPLIF